MPILSKVAWQVLKKIPLSVKLGGEIIRQRREQQYDALQQQDFFLCNRSGTGYGRDFQNSEYGKLEKVYSIWVCTNPPKDYQNTRKTCPPTFFFIVLKTWSKCKIFPVYPG